MGTTPYTEVHELVQLIHPVVHQKTFITCIIIMCLYVMLIADMENNLFTFDQISYVFRLTVTYIRVCVLIFRHFYIGSDKHYLYFHRLILLFISSIILLIFRSNSLRIILGWDGLGVSSYLLVLYYNNSLSSTCAITTVLRNRLGDLFLIVLLGFIFSLGRFNILINKFRFEFIFLRVLILFAGCTKRAQIPFRA